MEFGQAYPMVIIKYPPYALICLKEVAVYGIRVAAAVGTIPAIENTPPNLQGDHIGLYQLDPGLVAVMKNSKTALHPKIWDFVVDWDYFRM